jgi:hypothetical protein
MPRSTRDEIVPAFRQNFVKVTLDALMNGECGISATYGECGISATYSAAGELIDQNGPLIWKVRLRPGATLLKLGDDT